MARAPLQDPLTAADSATGTRTVFAKVLSLAGLSLFSPVVGLAVEAALAWRFGTSPVVDAYRVIGLLLLFAQQLFVTSILPFVIVPIFAEYRAQGREREIWAAADVLGRVFLGFGSAIALVFFMWPVFATGILAPGLTGESKATAILFVRWCAPLFIPLCWTGVACGTLYAQQVFYVAPLAQLASNATLLLAVAMGAPRLGAMSVALGMLGGALAGVLIYVLKLRSVRREFGPPAGPRSWDPSALRKSIRLAAPLLGGAIAGQMSGAVVTRALSRLGSGSLAQFGYAWKLGQIVLLIPNALSTVLFPSLSKNWQSAARIDFGDSSIRLLRGIFFITVPLTCVAFALRDPIVTLLLQRGAFSAWAAHATALLFGILIIGAPGGALAGYLDRTFYAMQETARPVLVDLGTAVVAMAAVPLSTQFGATGVACVYMLLPWISGLVLLGLFQRRQGGMRCVELGWFAVQVAIASAAAAWTAARVLGFWPAESDVGGRGLPLLALRLTAGFLIAGTVFLLLTWRFRLPEARTCRDQLMRLLASGFGGGVNAARPSR